MIEGLTLGGYILYIYYQALSAGCMEDTHDCLITNIHPELCLSRVNREIDPQ